MGAGSYNNLVEIHAVTTVSDGAGGQTETWTKITNGDAWLDIYWLKGAEQLQAMQMDAPAEARCRARYEWFGTITATHRLYFNSKYYEIVSAVNPDGARTRVEFLIREARI